MKDKKNIFLIAAFLIGILFVFLLIFFTRSSTESSKNVQQVEIIKDGGKLTVNRDGSVSYASENANYTDQWSNDKTNAYFEYFSSTYSGESETIRPGDNVLTVIINGQTYNYVLNEDDELADAGIIDSSEPDNNTNGGGGGTNTSSNTPTPAPTSNTQTSTPTPAPTSTSSGGGSFMDECLYWRLSYCVIPRPPSPTNNPSPTPTGSVSPDLNVIQVGDCEQYILEGNTEPTIISNEVCLPE